LCHTTKNVSCHQTICGFDDMTQSNADPHVRSDGAVPYWRLWSACFLGFGAIGMTIQVMAAYAHERLGANAITAGLAVTIGSLSHHDLPPSLRTACRSERRTPRGDGRSHTWSDRRRRPHPGDKPAHPGSRPPLSRRGRRRALHRFPAGSWPTQSNRSEARPPGILACRCGRD
jgi:hypothetical protein